MAKKALILLCILALVPTVFPNPASAKTYYCEIGEYPAYWPVHDVTGDWYYSYVYEVLTAGVMGNAYYSRKYGYYFYPNSYQPKAWWTASLNVAFEQSLPCYPSDEYLTREVAFDQLVRVVGLGPIAEKMSDSEAEQILSRFPDWSSVNPAYRKTVATAVKYGIVKGYDDGTLRPKQNLKRSEAAAVICRTAWGRIRASKSELYPYRGDAVVTFYFTVRSFYYGIDELKLTITRHSTGEAVLAQSWGYNPGSCSWNASGLPEGDYVAQLEITYYEKVGKKTYYYTRTGHPCVVRVWNNMPPLGRVVLQDGSALRTESPVLAVAHWDRDADPAVRWQLWVDGPGVPPSREDVVATSGLGIGYPGKNKDAWSAFWTAPGEVRGARLVIDTEPGFDLAYLYAYDASGNQLAAFGPYSGKRDFWLDTPQGTRKLRTRYRTDGSVAYGPVNAPEALVYGLPGAVLEGMCSSGGGSLHAVTVNPGLRVPYAGKKNSSGSVVWQAPGEVRRVRLEAPYSGDDCWTLRGYDRLGREVYSYSTTGGNLWLDLPSGVRALSLYYYDDDKNGGTAWVREAEVLVPSGTLSVPASTFGKGERTFKVRFRDAYGLWGDWSVLTHVVVDPVKPVITSPSSGQKFPTPDLTVSWQASDMAGESFLRYQVQVARDASFSSVLKDVSGTYPVPTGGCRVTPKGLRADNLFDGLTTSAIWSWGGKPLRRACLRISGWDVTGCLYALDAFGNVLATYSRSYGGDSVFDLPAGTVALQTACRWYYYEDASSGWVDVPWVDVDGPGYPACSVSLSGVGWGKLYVRCRVMLSSGAWGAWSDPVPFEVVDEIPPVGSISIAQAPVTSQNPVTLILSATDVGSGVEGMRFRNEGGSWTAWEPYAASRSWMLPSPCGVKRVYVQYRDYAGNVSPEYQAQVLWDNVPPAGGIAISGAPATNQNPVMLLLFASDAHSGVSHVRVRDEGGSWSGWLSFQPSLSWTLPGPCGVKRVYVQYRDAAGNVSPEYSAQVVWDNVPPTGSVSIAQAPVTNQNPVTLLLSASDAHSGVSHVRVRDEGGSWSGWMAYSSSLQWTLPSPCGTKRVYVQYRDAAGNVSPEYSAQVLWDNMPPSGSISIAQAPVTVNRTVTLILSAFDAHSGVAAMRLRNAGESWGSWRPFQSSLSWTLSEPQGRRKQVLIQFKDAAGNVSPEYQAEVVWDELYAFFDPAAVAQGGMTALKLRASRSWQSVSADLSALGLGTKLLSLEPSGLWSTGPLAVGVPPGTYSARVTASAGSSTGVAEAVLSVGSIGSDLER